MKRIVVYHSSETLGRIMADPAFVVAVVRGAQLDRPTSTRSRPSNRSAASKSLRNMSRSELAHVLRALMRIPTVREQVAAQVAATRRETLLAIRLFAQDIARRGGLPPLRSEAGSSPVAAAPLAQTPGPRAANKAAGRSARCATSTSLAPSGRALAKEVRPSRAACRANRKS